MIVVFVVVDGAKQLQDLRLLVALDVFLQSLGNGGFLGFETAEFDNSFNQRVIECEIGCHGVHTFSYTSF